MSNYLAAHEVVEALENAFRPLECRVDLYDERKRVAFGVFDSDGTLILPMWSWIAIRVRKPQHLRARIDLARRRVEEAGYVLDPWPFPA